jgi:hypothetical protein
MNRRPEPAPGRDKYLPDDLSPILKRLSAPRLANDSTTKVFLEAGRSRLFRELLRQPQEETDEEGSKARKREPGMFSWLSRNEVILEAESKSDAGASIEQHKYRWRSMEDYIEDVFSFSLYEGLWKPHFEIADHFSEHLSEAPNLAVVASHTAHADMRQMLGNPATRLVLIAAAVSDRYPYMKEVMGEVHRAVNQHWSKLYEEVISVRGMRLRSSGLDVHELAEILSALAFGLTARGIIDPRVVFTDEARQETLLGKAALALLVGCADSGDGLPLAERVNQVAQGAGGHECPHCGGSI